MLKVCVRLFGDLKILAVTRLAVLQPAMALALGSVASSGGKLDRDVRVTAMNRFGRGSR